MSRIIPIYSAEEATRKKSRLEYVALWMRDHQKWVHGIQWSIVIIYAVLLIAPLFVPLPGNHDHILTHITVFAAFCFWGIWWPFVLVSMVLFGRLWCGAMCPEGALSEWASKHGRGRPIPRWIRWSGWPFVGFVILTIYGQMVSVYQYPYPALLILGGSTLVAVVLGFMYTRGKRVWCRYLCPVSGVFNLLSRIAPMHYSVDREAWDHAKLRHADGERTPAPDCAPMLNIRRMEGAGDCHMCARCTDYRQAVMLRTRPMSEEIVELGHENTSKWHTLLIIFGLLGIAIGAFHWTASPYFIQYRLAIGHFLLSHEWYWALSDQTPWWLLTNYPENQDVFTWMDGFAVVTYIIGTACVMTVLLSSCLALSLLVAWQWTWKHFHHLAQALIPMAAMGVFLGLSATTVTLLKNDRYPVWWANDVRLICLVVATVFCLYLGYRVIGTWQTTKQRWRHILAWLPFAAALAVINAAWWLMFWHW